MYLGQLGTVQTAKTHCKQPRIRTTAYLLQKTVFVRKFFLLSQHIVTLNYKTINKPGAYMNVSSM